MSGNRLIDDETALRLKAFVAEKHKGGICIANYKGGVGKTTLVCLLGYYLSELGNKVLMIDIDPQCSLSLAVGFDPEEVSKTELTIYNLVKPSAWPKGIKKNLKNYFLKVPDSLAPKDLYIIRGSFEVENLDIEIAESRAREGERRWFEFSLFCKQLIFACREFDYVLVDCPPNKMYLTQGMLQACAYYLPVTIPDEISIYGMPRLYKWVQKIDDQERPKLLGYVLNALNRTGGAPGGMVFSQQNAEARLKNSISQMLDSREKEVIGTDPLIGTIPRLDIIARFLGEHGQGYKISRLSFREHTSNQPTVDECLLKIRNEVLNRIRRYRA